MIQAYSSQEHGLPKAPGCERPSRTQQSPRKRRDPNKLCKKRKGGLRVMLKTLRPGPASWASLRRGHRLYRPCDEEVDISDGHFLCFYVPSMDRYIFGDELLFMEFRTHPTCPLFAPNPPTPTLPAPPAVVGPPKTHPPGTVPALHRAPNPHRGHRPPVGAGR